MIGFPRLDCVVGSSAQLDEPFNSDITGRIELCGLTPINLFESMEENLLDSLIHII